MPRKKAARRFDPAPGVSQAMLDAESQYISRELEDYLLLSTDELREKLDDRQNRIAISEKNLQAKLVTLPNRERLALRTMLARDCPHIGLLYLTFLNSAAAPQASRFKASTLEELNQHEESRRVLPFKESLFD